MFVTVAFHRDVSALGLQSSHQCGLVLQTYLAMHLIEPELARDSVGSRVGAPFRSS